MEAYRDDVLSAIEALCAAHPHHADVDEALRALPSGSETASYRRILDALQAGIEVMDEKSMQLVDRVLKQERILFQQAITDFKQLSPFTLYEGLTRLCLWEGDITKLSIGAVVNPASHSSLLGCFKHGHPCVDNAMHCSAGPRLRVACRALTAAPPPSPGSSPQRTHAHAHAHAHARFLELTVGESRITPGFNLPAQYVLHTLGPVCEATHAEHSDAELAACYHSCLDLCRAHSIRSVAFPCISVGKFGYAADRAAAVALSAVKSWLGAARSDNARKIDSIVFVTASVSEHAAYASLGALVVHGDQVELTAVRRRFLNRARIGRRLSVAIRSGFHYPHTLGRHAH